MDVQLQHLLSISFRFVVVLSMEYLMEIYVMASMLKRRHRLIALAINMFVRLLFLIIIMDIVLRNYYYDRRWWDLTYFFAVLVTTGIFCVVLYYTFDESLTKSVSTIFISEFVIMPVHYFSLGIVNTLENHKFTAMKEEFQLLDLLVPICQIVIFVMIWWVLGPFLKRLKNYHMRFLNAVWFLGFLNLLSFFPKDIEKRSSVILQIWVALLLGVLSLLILAKYAKRTQIETSFLEEQQRMMEYHYFALQNQMIQIQEYQKMVDEQMTSVENRTVTRKNLSEYIDNLKQEYHQIWAGIYCDDRMIDAVLYSQTESLKKQGINLKCNLAGYDRGGIEEKDLAQIVMKILAWGTKEAEKLSKDGGVHKATSENSSSDKTIHLQMSAIKNKLMIECRVPTTKKNPPSKYMLRRMSKQYDGAVAYEYEEGEGCLTAVLTR